MANAQDEADDAAADAVPNPLELDITDLPGGSAGKPRTKPIKGLVIHHTGGSSLSSAYSQSKLAATGTNFYIDRDGKIYRRLPEDQATAHIQEPGTKYRDGSYPELSNDNTLGVEVVAADDKHVTPAQRQAIQDLGNYVTTKYPTVDKNNVVGHGELQGGPNGNREKEEGALSAQAFRSGTDAKTLNSYLADDTAPVHKMQAVDHDPFAPVGSSKTQTIGTELAAAAIAATKPDDPDAKPDDPDAQPDTPAVDAEVKDARNKADNPDDPASEANQAPMKPAQITGDTDGEYRTMLASDPGPIQVPQSATPQSGLFTALAQNAGVKAPTFIPVDHNPFSGAQSNG